MEDVIVSLILIALAFGAYMKLMRSIDDSRKTICELKNEKHKQIHKNVEGQNIEAEVWQYQTGFDFSANNDIK